MNRRSEHPSWPWILANAAGFAIGGAIAGGVVLAAELALIETVQSPAEAAAGLAPVTAVGSTLLGGTAGVLQWLVIRRWLPGSGWWIAATAGGWAAAGVIAGILSGFLGGTVTGVGPGVGVWGYLLATVCGVAAIGLLPGVLQSLVLRHRIGAIAWSAAHMAAVLAGFVVAFPVMLVVAPVFGWSIPSSQVWAVGGLLMGTVVGIITWGVLKGLTATRPQGPREDAPPRANSISGARGEPPSADC